MTISLCPMTFEEWERIWSKQPASEYGLRRTYTHQKVECADDIDDYENYEVIDKHKFFLAVIKHGIKYDIIIPELNEE